MIWASLGGARRAQNGNRRLTVGSMRRTRGAKVFRRGARAAAARLRLLHDEVGVGVGVRPHVGVALLQVAVGGPGRSVGRLAGFRVLHILAEHTAAETGVAGESGGLGGRGEWAWRGVVGSTAVGEVGGTGGGGEESRGEEGWCGGDGGCAVGAGGEKGKDRASRSVGGSR